MVSITMDILNSNFEKLIGLMNKSRIFLPALVSLLILCWGESASAQPGQGPATVAVGQVVKIRHIGEEKFFGTLHPIRKSTVGSAVDGRVLRVTVEAGDPVGADPGKDASPDAPGLFVGQPVTQIRTGTLEIEIRAAEIQHRLAEQAFAELELSIPQEIELAKAKVAESAARLELARSKNERAKRLGGLVGAISQGELDEANSQFTAEQQSFRGAEIDLAKMKSTQELRLVQSQLRAEAANQEVVRLNDIKSKYTIRAPFEGLVTEKLTDVGEWVTRGQPIVRVVQLNPIEMIINVPQKHLARLQLSLAAVGTDQALVATISIDNYSQVIQGRVKRVVAQADLLSRTFPVRIEIDNPLTQAGYVLQPGMLGRASMMIGAEQEMLMVHKDALVLGGSRVIVFKTVTSGKTTSVIGLPVSTGVAVGQWIQVTGDLSSNDQVVVLGNERLRTGQDVKINRVVTDSPQ